MSKKHSLSVFLGLRERTEKDSKNMLADMISKFKNKQGLFKGEKRTFIAAEGYADEPTKRGYKHVASTVHEQLEWLKEHTKEYLKVGLTIEKTNSEGVTAELIVDGTSWGEYSSLELLRIKGYLDGAMKSIIEELPVRDESIAWIKSLDENYKDRLVYESPLERGNTKTTLKQTVIVNDPHIKDSPNRPPVTSEISTQVNTGEATQIYYSGELSLKQRAIIKTKYEKLYLAVIEAMEKANTKEISESDLGDKVLDYLF
jgi:hypothetical protein